MDATDKPDIYSHRWYEQQLRGMQHTLNRLSAEYDSQYQRSERLAEQINKIIADAVARDAKIGELIARLESCEASLEKCREYVRELKRKT